MGRSPTTNKQLPKGMRARRRPSGVHYYMDTGGRPRVEVPLGKDYVLAVQEWARRTSMTAPAGARITFKHVADKYMRDVLPTKAPGTQRKNLGELANLLKFFGEPPVELNEIEPVNVRQYLDWRWKSSIEQKAADNAERLRLGRAEVEVTGKEGQVPANREKALFSHIWNYARNAGLTTLPNPCAGIRGFRELGRDAYTDDAVYDAVWWVADQGLQDAMDIAYLSAQRKADVLKFDRTDLKDDQLTVVQNKTGKRLRVSVEGQLAAVVERINRRKVTGLALVCNEKGERMTEFMLRGAFDRAREAAATARPELAEAIRAFQFRDLRAKAATDKEERSGMIAAQDQLGHTTTTMTAHYVRNRRGKLVKPTK
ncbi:tyrosine-type recombinase/integrase [Duganella sp. BJB476]|uniref:tyrosine-type recombinase/integrase n=1 Tax=Duganella sp. BJB476 TaxID=1871176 RepID=UPI000E34E2BF|nr:tyrosine-type recombinase/integrase [Duganella sp. BJB476]RFP32465.1 integrase [Duganella sp. BJB476]